MVNSKEKKKSKRVKYELEKRQIELEEQLLDVQQKRLDLEQKRIELQLKKVKLASKKKPRRSKSGSSADTSTGPPMHIKNISIYGRSDDDDDDDDSFETDRTGTTHEFSDSLGERASSFRFSGEESEGEEALSPSLVDTPDKSKDPVERAESMDQNPASTSEEEEEEEEDTVPKARAQSEPDITHNTSLFDNEAFQQSLSKRGQSMRNLVVNPRPQLQGTGGRATSLRDILAETPSKESDTPQECCNRSTETFESSKTKVTSNVSGTTEAKLLNRGRSYPSLTEDRTSRQNSSRTLSNGDLQNGEFVYVWPDGRRYEGSWREGKFHGLGVHTWPAPNGGKFVGQYKNGLKHGYGVYDWADGSKYEGQFAYGKRNGQGAQLNSDGTIYHNGLWKDDEPIRDQQTGNP